MSSIRHRRERGTFGRTLKAAEASRPDPAAGWFIEPALVSELLLVEEGGGTTTEVSEWKEYNGVEGMGSPKDPKGPFEVRAREPRTPRRMKEKDTFFLSFFSFLFGARIQLSLCVRVRVERWLWLCHSWGEEGLELSGGEAQGVIALDGDPLD